MRELTELDRIHLVLALQRHTSKQQLAQQASERAPAWGNGLWEAPWPLTGCRSSSWAHCLIAATLY